MKSIYAFLCLLLLSCSALAQQTVVTGTLVPYANGNIVETMNGVQVGSGPINGQGVFTILVSSVPNHTFTLSSVPGSVYAPFTLTVTVGTNRTTDISQQLIAAMPIPNPFIVPSLLVQTPDVNIFGVQYAWPSSSASGPLCNDGENNLVWGGCGGGGSPFITSLTTNGTSGPSTVTAGVLNVPVYAGITPAGTNAVQSSSADGTTLGVATPSQLISGLQTSGKYVMGPKYILGDSTNENFGASVTERGGTSLLAKDMLGYKYFFAVGGTFESQIMNSILLNVQPVTNSVAILPVVIANGGVNDANTCGNTTGCLNNFTMEQTAAIAWTLMPKANVQMASTATITSFTPSATLPLQPNVVGSAESSQTVGGHLNWTVANATATRIGVYWLASTVGTASQFTFSIDGTAQTFTCTGTTTFTSQGCNGQAISNTNFTVFRQDFAVTPSSSHAVVLTVTAAGTGLDTVNILAIDSNPQTSSMATQPLMIQMGVLRQNADANAATTLAFDNASAAVVTALAAENLQVVRADLRNGIPGVNATTDMAATSATCLSSGANTPLHPNDCGYQDQASTVENAALAAGFNIFYKNLGSWPNLAQGTVSVVGGPVVGVQQNASNYANYWNTNLGVNGLGSLNPSASLMSPGLSFAPNAIYPGAPGGGTVVSAVGRMWDANNSVITTGIFSSDSISFLHCPTSANPVFSACTSNLFINGATGAGTFHGTASAPAFISSGTTFSVTGCGTATGLVGGSTSGQFTGGSATCAPVITMGGVTAPHGFSCYMNDQTTSTALFFETANNATTATFAVVTGIAGATDVINFGCMAF